MKKVWMIVAMLICLAGLSSGADAQLALRAGGGAIFDPSQFGGHASLILPFSSKPGGVMIAAEYYKKSGFTTIPLSARGLYKASGETASIYLGLGSGIIYTKQDGGAAITLASVSSTKVLFSAVVGLNIKFSGPLGLFGEGTLDRALASGANNNWAAKAGVSLTISD